MRQSTVICNRPQVPASNSLPTKTEYPLRAFSAPWCGATTNDILVIEFHAKFDLFLSVGLRHVKYTSDEHSLFGYLHRGPKITPDAYLSWRHTKSKFSSSAVMDGNFSH